MGDFSVTFTYLMALIASSPMSLLVIIIVAVSLGLAAGRLGISTANSARINALETSYTQVLRDSYIIRRVVESTSDGLVVQTMDGKVLWVNPAYCEMMRMRPEDMIGRNPLSYAMTEDERPSDEDIASFRFDAQNPEDSGLHIRRNQRGDGELFWNQISLSFRTAPDGTEHAILACRDVTEMVEREKELEAVRNDLEFTADHDDLTGIANRTALMRFTQDALDRATEENRQIGMLRVDLDKFKEINDTHGHPAGDAVLVNIATVLRNNLRKSDLVARVGGDEFVVVCPDIGSLEDLEAIAHTLARACARPFEWANGTLKCSASFGAALSDLDNPSLEDLLQHSDFALYEVKRLGRGGVVGYTDDMHRRYTQVHDYKTLFAEALRNRELTFYFQPTLNLMDGSISGFETLMRWTHPELGLQTPDKIIPIAMEMGLMAELDLAAMEEAISMKRELRDAGHPKLRLGLNASADGLLHPEFTDRLIGLVQENDFNPDQIAIEVLETVMLDGSPHAEKHAKVISQLHRQGFQTLLDDFGIGHAGLAHLAQLELSGVKIDRALASRVLEDRVSHRIVRTVIELCEDLDLRLIAEGVEDIDVAICLRDMGCPVLQGFWLSKPLPREEVIPWLTNRVVMPLPYGPSATVFGEALPSIKKRASR